MTLLVLILICAAAYILISGTPTETKLKEKVKEFTPIFKDKWQDFIYLIKTEVIAPIKEKIRPSKWEYLSSWCSKGGRVLYVRVQDQYNNTKKFRYTCNSNGRYFSGEDGKYVSFSKQNLFDEYTLQRIWLDCMDNNRFSDE